MIFTDILKLISAEILSPIASLKNTQDPLAHSNKGKRRLDPAADNCDFLSDENGRLAANRFTD